MNQPMLQSYRRSDRPSEKTKNIPQLEAMAVTLKDIVSLKDTHTHIYIYTHTLEHTHTHTHTHILLHSNVNGNISIFDDFL